MIRRVGLLLAVFFGIHAAIGIYAVSDGGDFLYGATAPERYLFHVMSGAESHYTVSGALKHYTFDVCIQKSEDYFTCYPQTAVALRCRKDDCQMETAGGTLLLVEDERVEGVAWDGVLTENCSLICEQGNASMNCAMRSELKRDLYFDRKLPGRISIMGQKAP